MTVIPKGLIRAVKHSERKYNRSCMNLNRLGCNGAYRIIQTPEYKECEREWDYLTELRNRLNFLKACECSLSRKFHQ